MKFVDDDDDDDDDACGLQVRDNCYNELLRFVVVKTERCVNRDELWERIFIQLDVLQDSQRASQLVHSCQQMSL